MVLQAKINVDPLKTNSSTYLIKTEYELRINLGEMLIFKTHLRKGLVSFARFPNIVSCVS